MKLEKINKNNLLLPLLKLIHLSFGDRIKEKRKRGYFLLTEDAPEVVIVPRVGCPVYCREEAPLASTFSSPVRLISA